MSMRLHVSTLVSCLALCAAWSAAARADRQPGWDFGADLIYQFSQDIDFDGGSSASLDDDLGLALTFGYRFSDRFELAFGLDWNKIDYDVNVASGNVGGQSFSGHGDLEAFTPYIGANFNLFSGNLTPYLTGKVGWSFIDTNIPNGPPVSSCWWDPWYGYVCGTWQETRNIDELAYAVGVGVRWDASSTITVRFGYERTWLDYGEATSTPGFDQLRVGIAARY
jgi:opacity protein-like surface antigen